MPKKAQIPYEDAMVRLEEIVRTMESGKLTLDETAALYEEGLRLTTLCRSKLERVRTKVMKLTGSQDKLREVPFETEDDDDDEG